MRNVKEKIGASVCVCYIWMTRVCFKVSWTLCTFFIALSILTFLSACSTTSNLPEGEVLYAGIKEIKYSDKKNTYAESFALTEVEAALAYAPNGSFMGSSSIRTPFPIGLWIHNGLVNKQKSWFGKWMFNTFGTPPVTISAVNPLTRTKIATNLLQNYGYFHGKVDYHLDTLKNPREQKITYDVKLGRAYVMDTIKYMFPYLEDSIIRSSDKESFVKYDKQFSVVDLQSERERIVSELHNNGFYFYRPDYISYFADSSYIPGRVKLLIAKDLSTPVKAGHQYYIGNISSFIRNSSGTTSYRNSYTDTINAHGMPVAYQGKRIPIKPAIMFRNFRFWQGDMFDQSKVDNTITGLNNMSVFSGVQFSFTPRDTTDSCSILDVRFDASMAKAIDLEVDFNITQKSNSQVGPNLGVTFSKNNAFHHGETLSVGLKGSYEWQTDRSLGASSTIDSYEYGVEASLAYPWIVFPGFSQQITTYPSSSKFRIGINQLNRATYYRLLSFGIDVEYGYQTMKYLKHKFMPLTVTFNKLQSTSAKFDSITATNSALYVSLRDQFIPAMQYSITYDNTTNKRLRYSTNVEATIKESGNVISGLMCAAGKDFSVENKHFLGSPYSQFLKLDVQLRNKFKLTDKSLLATRVHVGAIWTYGNSSIAPYSELFYVGGANSVRAFGVRSIGPGRYYDYAGRGTYLDQSGDLKLEANVEYRFNMISNLNGAFFLDAGNVWLIREDDSHEGGVINSKDFLKDLAVGTGFGFRYDMEFLVLRFDVGIALHAPYKTGKTGYYNIRKFYKDGVAFHFAVGYPF